MTFLRLLLGFLFILSLSLWADAFPYEYVSTRKVEVCTIPLPVTSHITINRLIFNTKHIYLKVNGKTFGTPFTSTGTYFGGDAYLYSEDIFYQRSQGAGEECFPTHHFLSDTEENFQERLLCLAGKMTYPQKDERPGREWFPTFDYHVLKNNCGSMANFLVECARGKILRRINYSIGDVVEPTKEAKITYINTDHEVTIPSSYGEICQLALDECDN